MLGSKLQFYCHTQIEDVALQLSHNLAYLDLESTLEEQTDELEGFRDRYSSKYCFVLANLSK